MSLHDDYARRTPFELAFPDHSTVQALLADVDAEAEGRGADPTNPQSFITLGAIAGFVRGLEGPEPPPGAIHQLGALVYHGVHFAREGHPLYLLTAQAARYLVGGVPDGVPEPTTTAGYLQLPQHLFWTEEADGCAESVDGIHWTMTADGVLHSLLVTGMRADRPGLDVVPLPEAPIADAPSWLDATVREVGRDYATTLPGGEIDGLYSFQAAGEVLKLLARFFAYVARSPGALHSMEPPGDRDGPAPSTLGYERVTLDG